jgi:HAD superfamily hydrolase (TIGR01549 family)
MGGDQLVKALAGEHIEAELGDAVRAAHDALYLAQIDSVSAFAGSRGLLEELDRAGCATVLASSASEQEIDHYLDLLDARELVRGWTTSADVDRTKPDPDLLAAALDKLAAGNAIMVGDSPWDVEAARRAGVPTVAVLTGGFAAGELEEAGAVRVHESISQLRERLDAELLRPLRDGLAGTRG